MKKKISVFTICSFLLAVLIFCFSYLLFHHLSPEGRFTLQWYEEPAKPLVTELFAVLGVQFLFLGLAGALARFVFFGERKNGKK